MKILALDIATTTGWAFLNINKKVHFEYGTIEVTPQNRLKEIKEEISLIVKKYSPDIILIEDVFFSKNFRSFKILSMLRAAVYLGCIENCSANILEATATTIRKTIGVKNNKREKIKKIVITKVNKILKTKIKNSDVADALAIIVAYLNDKKVFNGFTQ